MSFSFRSMFQANPDSRQEADPSVPGNLQSAFSIPAQNPSNNMTVSAPPLNAASPFGAPLFKFTQGEAVNTAPLQQSPFAASPSPSTSAPLTVADILPLLPPEIARTGALPMEQPVAVSPQVLNEALRGGQAALPIFEIYRVCPALFQTPISPQDPRMIPLPTSKLPYLIAATTQASATNLPPAVGASPFSMPASAPEAQAPSMSAAPSGMMLPPRRQGPPPPLADVPNREAAAPQLSLPGQPSLGAPAFPMSPFAAAGSQINEADNETKAQPLTASPFGQSQQPAPVASPFGQATSPTAASPFGQSPQAAPAASPFGQAPSPTTASPFGQSPQATPVASPFGQAPSPTAASPFGQSPQAAPAASPFGQSLAPVAATSFNQEPQTAPAVSPFAQIPQAAPANPMESPLGSLFGAKAVPTGEPAPDVASARPAQPPVMPMASAPSTSAPLIRICFANLLKGYTSAELGFDPMVVPAWITTALPSAKIQELASAQAPIAELGLFVDGITDVGFRNVLNTAKRDFQLRVPVEELQAAMAGASAPQTLPNLASLGATPALVAAPAPSQNIMRVEPINAAPSAQMAPPLAAPADLNAASIPGPTSPFLAPASRQVDALPSGLQSPSMPSFSSATSTPTLPPSGFGMPAAALQPLTPKTVDPFAQPASGQTKPLFTFQPQQPAPQPQATFQPQQATPQPQATFQPQQASFESSKLEIPTTFKAPEQEPQISFFQPQSFESKPPEAFRAPQSFFTQQEERTQLPAQEPTANYPITETTVLPPERHQESNSLHSGFSFMKSSNPMEEGFTSDQLLGRQPSLEQSWSAAAVAAASGPLDQSAASETRGRQSPVIDVPEAAAPKPRAAFTPPRIEEPAPAPVPAAQPAARPQAVKVAPSVRNHATNSNLGVQMYDTDPDQILLRALLDTDSELTPQKVVEMACGLPGIAACVCIQGTQSISHIGAHKPQAREFQKQATDLAQHLRTLAPLIGIEGAETFTMNSGDRLMTFCFPEGSILGVLHDAEPTLGLRDKITLIARELSRMII